MADWQPIETAPKDCEIIGVHYRDYGDGIRPSCYGPWTIRWNGKKWASSWDGCEVISYQSDFGTEFKEPDCEPTHWVPLPPAPETENGK